MLGAALIGTLTAFSTARSDAAVSPVDRPLRIIQTTDLRVKNSLDPTVPSAGEVRVLVLIDEKGALNDILLLGSTHRAYTDLAVTGLQQWRFEPAESGGQPVGLRTMVRLFFESRGRVVSVQGVEALSGLMNKPFEMSFEERLVPRSQLDAPLRPIAPTLGPRFPAQLSGKIPETSSVVVDFYVDETGRPRMPVIAQSDHDLLSQAALNAVDTWKFAPPTRRGMPVVVHVRQEFVFRDNARPPVELDTGEPRSS